jgi:predicted Zn-dependent protease
VQTLLLLQENEPSANLKYFKERLKDNPNDIDSLYGLAVTEGKIGLEKESFQNFLRALRFNSNDADILLDFGISLFGFGKFQEAAAYLRRAIAADKENAKAKIYLGKALLGMGNIAEALGLLKEFEKKSPDDPDICYNLAIAYGKYADSGLSHYYFGRYFKMKGKVESALFHFKEALNELPSGEQKFAETRKEIDNLQNPSKKE